MALSQRLELERRDALQGSSLLIEPNNGAAVARVSRRSETVTSTSVVTSTSSTVITLDVAAVGAAGVDETAAQDTENDGSQSNRSRRGNSGRDFQLV